ncbi:hypothetical protein CC2G_005008 [Coprinopsis cinerea AmutBmut pab1-1]|nr:hypothetical protein CC2G_005008 [Coprinopsis cinerea AmutBmut pab1-1]
MTLAGPGGVNLVAVAGDGDGTAWSAVVLRLEFEPTCNAFALFIKSQAPAPIVDGRKTRECSLGAEKHQMRGFCLLDYGHALAQGSW